MTLKKILTFFIIFFSSESLLHSEIPHYLDFKLILNESDAGKKAQTFLKNKLENYTPNNSQRNSYVKKSQMPLNVYKKYNNQDCAIGKNLMLLVQSQFVGLLDSNIGF